MTMYTVLADTRQARRLGIKTENISAFADHIRRATLAVAVTAATAAVQ